MGKLTTGAIGGLLHRRCGAGLLLEDAAHDSGLVEGEEQLNLSEHDRVLRTPVGSLGLEVTPVSVLGNEKLSPHLPRATVVWIRGRAQREVLRRGYLVPPDRSPPDRAGLLELLEGLPASPNGTLAIA